MRYIKVKGGIRLVGECGEMNCMICIFNNDFTDTCKLGDVRPKGPVKSSVIKEAKGAKK